MNDVRPPLPGFRALMLLVVGGTVLAAGLAMLLAGIVGLARDGREVGALLIPGLGAAAVGALALVPTVRRPHGLVTPRPVIGFTAVASAWLIAGLVGSIPFLAAGTFSSPIDAIFEATSGFTTTGATLIRDIDGSPDAILLWRSLTQFMGGVGIVVLVVAIAPLSGTGLQRVFYAEVSGIKAERLTPRIIDTAKIIASIYIGLTLAAGVAYAVAGMSPWDAANHMLTTISTGGFSTHTDSFAHFDSVAIEVTAGVLMAMAGVNIAFYWLAIRGRRLMPAGAEVAAYLLLLVSAIAVVAISVDLAGDSSRPLRDGFFSAVTMMTGTGYTTVDFDQWNDFSRIVILVLMSLGACAGSTTGGIKTIRVMLLAKAAVHELDRQIQPKAVHVLRFGGRTFSEDIRRAILGFFMLYVLIYLLGTLAMAASGLDPITSISGASSMLNIIGPALGDLGATGNFNAAPPGARVAGIVLMLIGRLELFTIIAVLAAVVGYFRRTQARPTGIPRR